MGSNAVDTLPLGFDFVSFDTESKNAHLKQPAIVYSGSMKADQSVDAAIFLAREVMPLVWQTNKDAHLYIVGGGPTAEVLSLASDRIHVTGYVQDMASYLRSCRVYVCPLRLGSGMRTRVVEALAYGVSMVATSMAVRGIGTPKAGAAWIAAETAPEFAVSIISVLDGLHPSMPEIGARYVRENFSWPILASKLITYYAMVLKQ
jgi:glycosyltransferase involved in cell wall biosynthesis